MTVEVLPAVGRYDDFFEVVGVKKPGGGGCWCMAYRDSRVPNEERAQYMRDECAQEPGPGVLAYVDGEVAGWCSVAPRSSYRRLMHSRTIPFVDDRDAWSIVCFVVRPRFRRQGLMHELLEGAVAHAPSERRGGGRGLPDRRSARATGSTSSRATSGPAACSRRRGSRGPRRPPATAAAGRAWSCAASCDHSRGTVQHGSGAPHARAVPQHVRGQPDRQHPQGEHDERLLRAPSSRAAASTGAPAAP